MTSSNTPHNSLSDAELESLSSYGKEFIRHSDLEVDRRLKAVKTIEWLNTESLYECENKKKSAGKMFSFKGLAKDDKDLKPNNSLMNDIPYWQPENCNKWTNKDILM